MNVKRKCRIRKLFFPVDGYMFDVQVLTSIDGGNTWYYCGVGRFTKTIRDALQWVKAWKEENNVK
jgi:hypothetical protein